jgi:hypothetical protein
MTTNIEQGSNGMHNGAQQGSEFKGERESSSSQEVPLERRGNGSSGNNELSEGMKARNDESPLTRLSNSIKSPTGGATIAGAIGLGAATVFGVVETLVGAGAAYGVYRLVCKRQRSPR